VGIKSSPESLFEKRLPERGGDGAWVPLRRADNLNGPIKAHHVEKGTAGGHLFRGVKAASASGSTGQTNGPHTWLQSQRVNGSVGIRGADQEKSPCRGSEGTSRSDRTLREECRPCDFQPGWKARDRGGKRANEDGVDVWRCRGQWKEAGLE